MDYYYYYIIIIVSIIYIYIWLVVSTYPSEKYDFVSWDDDIPNWMEK